MAFKDVVTSIIHLICALIAVVGVICIVAGFYAIATLLLAGAWLIDRDFKHRCNGFYNGEKENCSIDYIDVRSLKDGENIDDGNVIDAEWEELE